MRVLALVVALLMRQLESARVNILARSINGGATCAIHIGRHLTSGAFVRRIRDGLTTSAGRAWSAARSKTQNASGEAKATTAGAVAGGVVASTAGAHIGIAALGTAVSGAALLPVVATVAVGSIAGYAAYKVFKDLKARRSQERSIGTTVPPVLTDARKVES